VVRRAEVRRGARAQGADRGWQGDAVIDRTYPLTDVPKALEYVERGHAHGKVVIAVA